MMTVTVDAFSQLFPAFARTSDQTHLSTILESLETRQIPAGQVLIKQDTPSQYFYMLVDGSLSVTLHDHGQAISLGNINKGGCAGEISMLDDAPEPATVTAQSDCTVLALSDAAFRKLDKQKPAATTCFLRSLSHIMADRVRAATDLTLPLLDSAEAPADLDDKLEKAYASLYGLGEKS